MMVFISLGYLKNTGACLVLSSLASDSVVRPPNDLIVAGSEHLYYLFHFVMIASVFFVHLLLKCLGFCLLFNALSG